jgi:copper transport protein
MLRVLILAALLAATAAGNAFAHATLLSAQPADGALLAQAPAEFVLTFNEPVSPIALRLVEPDGSGADLADVVARDATVTAPAPALAKGTHALSWRVISADGHPVGGSLVFSVGAISTMEPTAAQAPTGRIVAIWLARLVLYFGMFAGAGGAFFAAWVADGPLPRPAARFVAVGVWLGAVAAAASLAMQGLDVLDASPAALLTPQPWSAALGTTYALTLALAAIALLLAAAGQRWSTAIAIVLVGTALAASGHAADASPQQLTRAAVFVHGVSLAFWLGTLVPLAATLRTGALARFSRLAPLPVALIVASGATLAVVQLGSPSALWLTAYGRIFAAKIALVLVLLAVAAWNRYRLTPSRDVAALRRTIAIEVVLAGLILGVVATWRFTPPPRALALVEARAAPIHFHVHGEKAMADVSLTPGAAGPVAVSLAIQSGDFGLLDAKAVTLTLTNPAAGIEAIRREASHLDGALWRVDGLVLPAPGTWTARIDILVSDFDQVSLEQSFTVPAPP